MSKAMDGIAQKYTQLKDAFKSSAKSDNVTDTLSELFYLTSGFLSTLNCINLTSKVEGKTYFVFEHSVDATRTVISRAVNKDLYYLPTSIDSTFKADLIDRFWEKVKSNNLKDLSAHDLTCAMYTIVISFCCSIDLLKDGDQQTPGTYFEHFIGHLFAKQLDVLPQRGLKVNDDTLKTDLIFKSLNQTAFHVPVKISTRERGIQVWAQQKILDGAFGYDAYRGILCCLAETDVKSKKKQVIEVCIPQQWHIYQKYITQMKRIYYLDIPKKYQMLDETAPRIIVKELGEFFHEIDTLST